MTPLTGSVALIGKPLTRGHEVYFQYVNDTLGGVGKNLPKEQRYKVELITLDTQYLPDVHVQQYNAVKEKVAVIAQSLGTPQTKAICSDRDDKIVPAPHRSSGMVQESTSCERRPSSPVAKPMQSLKTMASSETGPSTRR